MKFSIKYFFSKSDQIRRLLCCILWSGFTLPKKYQYLEFFWSMFSLIRIEYGDSLRKSLYSAQIRENTDQAISEYENFLGSVSYFKIVERLEGL